MDENLSVAKKERKLQNAVRCINLNSLQNLKVNFFVHKTKDIGLLKVHFDLYYSHDELKMKMAKTQ
jgi:hypothetical protein